jgi:hypothetical protein
MPLSNFFLEGLKEYKNTKEEEFNSSNKQKTKKYKESNIMKARSDIKKKGDKYVVETDMSIKNDLLPKAKRALKKSVETELKKELGSISGKGGGIRKYFKGKGIEDDDIVKPKPLVRNQTRQDMIDEISTKLYEDDGINIMDLLDNKDLTHMDKDAVVVRNNILSYVIDEIEPNGNFGLNSYKVWEEMNPRDKSRSYSNDYNKGLNPIEKHKDEIYTKARKQLEKNDKKIKKFFNVSEGTGFRKIDLDLSSDDEKPKKRRGRPKKGKGYESDSSSDEDDIKEYGKILEHLLKHIKDPKEKNDKDDYKQAIELIKKIKSKKA